MKYLLFDHNAVASYVNASKLQSTEYSDGMRLVEHFRGKLDSEVFYNTAIEYFQDGIIFVGANNIVESEAEDVNKHIFCIDLTTCSLFSEETNDARVLTVMQKAFRLVLRIWNRHPFSASERVNGSKSILFPFSIADRHRLVIERSIQVQRLESRGIKHALLAYKYNNEEPTGMEETVDTRIIRQAGELYAENKYALQSKIETRSAGSSSDSQAQPLIMINQLPVSERNDFIFLDYQQQYDLLTDSQKKIVDFENDTVPIRINGAAGTGKTMALIMRAYRLLREKRELGMEYHIVFFAHSMSTSLRNKETFQSYCDSNYYLNSESEQSIEFTTLLTFCQKKARIEESEMIEADARNAKDYQLMIIGDIVDKAINERVIKTFFPLVSPAIKNLFDNTKTNSATLINMLQHEFSVQIKGRTDCTLDRYIELRSIPNGITCINKYDKELIFTLFTLYQRYLEDEGHYDVDDVTMEALSRLNAPIWRRDRNTEGYDYIFVDEMHLFNFNEQSVFHYLYKKKQDRRDDVEKIKKTNEDKNIPICFALDYNQSIGDLGDTDQDYISSGKLGDVNKHTLATVFRNSPQIIDFCASVAASGTLMFGSNFVNPYNDTQNQFTQADERKMDTPVIHMYLNDDAMISALDSHLASLMQKMQCQQKDIAIISFDSKMLTDEGLHQLEERSKYKFQRLGSCDRLKSNQFVFSSPYDINGLEFKAVILLGVDEGRLPQTFGTSDISKNYIMYSAYNTLYLTASRAKYNLVLLGSEVNGMSSCLKHSIDAGTIEVKHK